MLRLLGIEEAALLPQRHHALELRHDVRVECDGALYRRAQRTENDGEVEILAHGGLMETLIDDEEDGERFPS